MLHHHAGVHDYFEAGRRCPGRRIPMHDPQLHPDGVRAYRDRVVYNWGHRLRPSEDFYHIDVLGARPQE